MHFCTAYIAIANDEQQVAYRGTFDPISWPEIEVLRTIHGDEAVRNVKPFVWVDQDARAEQQRLLLIYGVVVTDQVYRGRKPAIEMDAAEMDVLEPGTLWMNPITREVAPVPGSEEEVEVEEEIDVEDDESPAANLTAAERAEKKRLYNQNYQRLRRKEREAKAAGTSGPDEPTPEL